MMPCMHGNSPEDCHYCNRDEKAPFMTYKEENENLRQRVKELEEQVEATLNEALKLARQGAEYCFNQAKDADANAAVQNAAVHELTKQLTAQAEQIKVAREAIEYFLSYAEWRMPWTAIGKMKEALYKLGEQ